MSKSAFKFLFIDVFVEDRFYGTLKVRNQWGGPFVLEESELTEIVESRLPFLRHKKYQLVF